MNEPKTPNLGLNKIDRSSPSTTYFDLDKYLDQNWEKVDGFAEQVEGKAEETAAQVSGIQERLNTEKRRSVTLEPGLQVINAERASAFKLEGLKGRTLVNLLGRDGGCENTSNWFTTAGVMAELDRSHTTQGSHSIKILLKEGSTGGSLYKQLGQSLSNNKNYLAIADLKRGTSSSVSLSLWNGTANVSGTVVTADIFSSAILLIPASSLGTVTNNLQISVVGSELGQFGYVDAVRLYEITGEELTSLSTMSANEITAKYPYVDSIQPVSNPYVIRYGENLLPPFYEWEHTGHTFLETSQNTATGELVAGSIGTDAYAVTYLSVLANQEYTISNPAESTGKIRVSIYDTYTRLQGMFINPGETKTIKTALTAVRMGINLSGVTQYTDEFEVSKWTWTVGNRFSFKSPIMTLGKSGILFKPHENAILALQTDLYADPVTGRNADEVFEEDGCYFKLKKWQRTALDGALGYQTVQNKIDYKIIGCKFPEAAAAFNRLFVSKYNGNLLTKTATMVGPDNAYFLTSDLSDFNLSIANADSGWGDSYTPTADEIKAYFMGWRMAQNVTGFPVYNGTGTKCWYQINTLSAPQTAFPTDSYAKWTPYQLVYQLATPTIESITTHGQLTLIEGNNQVEVGTGLVVREAVNYAMNTVSGIDYYQFNNKESYINTPFKYRVEKILNIYANGKRANGVVLKSEAAAYGKQDAHIEGKDFVKDAAYTATYFMLDTSPVAPFVGTVAENEKALLTDMNDIIRQNAAAVSVVEAAINEAVRNMKHQNIRNVWGEIL